MQGRILAPIVVVVAACGAPTQRAAVSAPQPQTAAPALVDVHPAAKDYDVDTSRSRFEVWGKDLISGNHEITFTRWKAHVQLVDDVPTIDADVDATSAEVDLPGATAIVRDHLLEAQKYPHATLHATMRSTGRKKNEVVIEGESELHGVKKELRFTGILRQEGDRFRLNAAFVVDRQEFGIHYGPMEPFLRDDVRVVLDVVAVATTSAGGSSVPRSAPDDASPSPSAPR